MIVVVPLCPGKSNPYCELTMGPQCYTSRSVSDTLNPKWNFNCQFFINDVYQDVLCITVFEKDQFSPDGQQIRRRLWSLFFFFFFIVLGSFNIFSFFPSPDFLGRTKVPVATIKKEMEVKGAASRHFLLHEVATGEVCVKLDLQLYDK